MNLIGYYRNHKVAVAIVFILLVVQAFSDLALPSFTSQIVDVGIQQSGVESVAVDRMTAQTLDQACEMSSSADAELIRRSYSLDSDGRSYALNDYGCAHREQLEELLAAPLVAVHLGDGARPATGDDASAMASDADEGQPSFSDELISQQALAAAKAEYEAAGCDLQDMQMSFLLRMGAIMLALAALGMLMSICIGFVASRTGAKIGFDLRSKLFSRVVSFSEGEISRFSAASLITRGTNDIQMIQNISVMLLRMALSAPILAVGGIIMVTATNAQMGWIVVIAVVLVLCVVFVVFKVAIPKFKIMQRLIDRVNLVAREMLTGMPVIRAFGRQAHEQERFDAASIDLMRTQLFTNRVMTFMMPVMNLIMNVTSVAVVWIGGFYIDAGSLQTGDLIAFITYSMMIIMSFLMLGMVSIMLPRAEVAAGRVNEVISTVPEIRDPDVCSPACSNACIAARSSAGSDAAVAARLGSESDAGASEPALSDVSAASGASGADAVSAASAAGAADAANDASDASAVSAAVPSGGARIVFDNVSFAYAGSDECVLKGISFEVEPGQTLAIVGPTGSGKSTLVKLMMRFYDPTEGAVLVDGVDIRNMALHELRSQFGYAPQKAFLFSGTIASNVAYSDESMGDDRMESALSISQALDFVNAKEDGVDAAIAQGGTNVSGGQRQRLSMARAFATKARAYLLDDSFSALDYKTDAALRSALDKRFDGVTKVIVAQRISTIMNADRIIVLDEGRLVGDGVHERLMRDCAEYAEIAHSQLSSLELGEEGSL